VARVGARARDGHRVSSEPAPDRRHTWVDQQADLEAVIDALVSEPAYAIDTEFHRERTYFPALALVQLGWADELILIDPLAVDVHALARLFESPAEAVFHAAQQDLDVLTYAVGAVPLNFFDTQIAAGFLGYGTPSLVTLLTGELGVSPPKGDRLTDWLRRPLTDAQREYAASDVAYLLELRGLLLKQLGDMGRLQWVADACAELGQRPTSGTNPEDAWTRLKDARGLRPRARAVAQAVAAWREQAAMARNVPVRQVLPDLAILGIAQRQPTTERDLSQARGVDERFSRGKLAAEILAAVERGKEAEPPDARHGGDELERDLRPAVALVSAWVSQVARTERIDASILATRADLVAFLARDADARLSTGWRAELLGDGINRLIEGSAALTFDRGDGLRMVDTEPPA
jgi:ribonuclease D